MGLFGRTRTETAPVEDVVERHRRFKLAAAAVLHEFADDRDRDWCSTYDYAVIEVGLPGRADHGFSQEVTGEATSEAFEAWRRAAGRQLTQAARNRGIVGYAGVLARAGFPAPVTREVEVTGTFTLRVQVEAVEGEDPATLVDGDMVRSQVYRTRPENLTWSAAALDQ